MLLCKQIRDRFRKSRSGFVGDSNSEERIPEFPWIPKLSEKISDAKPQGLPVRAVPHERTYIYRHLRRIAIKDDQRRTVDIRNTMKEWMNFQIGEVGEPNQGGAIIDDDVSNIGLAFISTGTGNVFTHPGVKAGASFS